VVVWIYSQNNRANYKDNKRLNTDKPYGLPVKRRTLGE